MAFQVDDDDAVMSEINMTPLVDVMLVLLIIFIITVPVMKHSVNIALPRASSQPQDLKPQTVRIAVNAQGDYFVNDAKVSDAQLAALLKAEAARQPQAAQARLLRRRVDLGRGGQAARQQQLQHHRPAMCLQLEHVLAGVGMRCWEMQRESVVDHAAVGIAQRAVARLACLERLATQRQHQPVQAAARDADDADGSASRGGGNGDDRVLVARQHVRNFGQKKDGGQTAMSGIGRPQ